jgi:hypothetical protein
MALHQQLEEEHLRDVEEKEGDSRSGGYGDDGRSHSASHDGPDLWEEGDFGVDTAGYTPRTAGSSSFKGDNEGEGDYDMNLGFPEGEDFQYGTEDAEDEKAADPAASPRSRGILLKKTGSANSEGSASSPFARHRHTPGGGGSQSQSQSSAGSSPLPRKKSSENKTIAAASLQGASANGASSSVPSTPGAGSPGPTDQGSSPSTKRGSPAPSAAKEDGSGSGGGGGGGDQAAASAAAAAAMQAIVRGVQRAQSSADLCAVFEIRTKSVFDGGNLRVPKKSPHISLRVYVCIHLEYAW